MTKYIILIFLFTQSLFSNNLPKKIKINDDQFVNENLFYDLPKLETQNLILRAIQQSDKDELYRTIYSCGVANNDPAANRISVEQMNKRMADINNYMQRGLPTRWCITLKKNNTIIGLCGFSDCSYVHQRCNLGGMIASKYKEYDPIYLEEAYECIIQWAFKKNFNKITTFESTTEGREFWDQYYSKLGFVFEGILRQHGWSNGEFHDVLVYSRFNPWTKSN